MLAAARANRYAMNMVALPTEVSVACGSAPLLKRVLPPGEYVIGSAPEADIPIAAEGVSPRHALLSLRFNDWVVEDLGSFGGTLVNGEKITDARIVFPSQKIRIGPATISVRRLKTAAEPGETLGPQTEAVRGLLPEEILGNGKYAVGPVAGRGGMGVILDAHELATQRNVAMKLMLDCTRPEDIARFVQEAQITAQLEHPNIVPVHELGVNELDQPFYTMKFVRGVSLGKVLDLLALDDPATAKKYPLSALLTIFQKVCDATAFAHSKGIIHRDLKPENVMLGEYGEALVMDWGLAKMVGSEAQKPAADSGSPEPLRASPYRNTNGETGTPTAIGTIMGTAQYMSPEQASGEVAQLDARTDIYALGAILYHMLALQPPFTGERCEILASVRSGTMLRPAQASGLRKLPHSPGGRVPESVAAVAMKAMALDPHDRYATVPDLQREITAYQSGFATSAEKAGILRRAGLFLRRNRTLSIATALLLLSGAVFTYRVMQERDRAEAAKLVAGEQRDAAETHLYDSHMLQAGQHLTEGRPESARSLLQRHRRENGGRDLRGWEWFYLTGQLNQDRLRVAAHAGGVLAVAASADGSRLATAGADGEIAVWGTRGLVPYFRFRAHPGPATSVSWHGPGNMLASGGADGMVRVWDAATQSLLAEVRVGDGERVCSVAWRPAADGEPQLAIGSREKQIRLWKPLAKDEAGRLEKLADSENGVAALHWSADGKKLAVGGLDTGDSIEVFNLTDRSRFTESAPSGTNIYSIALDPTGRYVAAGSKHLTVTVFELDGKRRLFSEPLHRGLVSSLAWSPDGRRIASASHDGTIRITSPDEADAARQIFSGHIGEVNALVWLQLSGTNGAGALFSGGADGTLRGWTAATSADSAFATRLGNWISGARWSPDGRRIAVTNFEDRIHILDGDSGAEIALFPTRGSAFDVEWSPAGDQLAAASRHAGEIEVLDARTGKSLGTFPLPGVNRVAWSPSGKFLAAASPAGARVWDAQSGAQLCEIPRPTGSLAWSRDERRLALGGEDGAIQIWDAFAAAMTAEWRPAPSPLSGAVISSHESPRQVFDLAWSPDGEWLAFVTQDSIAGVIETRGGRLVRTFPGHGGGIWRLAWNRDGSRLATCGKDGVLLVFNTQTGDQVAQLMHGAGSLEVQAVDWSPDGRRLLTGGYDTSVRNWDAFRGHAIEAAEQLDRRLLLQPNDANSWREVARVCAQLGWAGRARSASDRAQELAPHDMTIPGEAEEAETWFEKALQTPPPP